MENLYFLFLSDSVNYHEQLNKTKIIVKNWIILLYYIFFTFNLHREELFNNVNNIIAHMYLSQSISEKYMFSHPVNTYKSVMHIMAKATF